MKGTASRRELARRAMSETSCCGRGCELCRTRSHLEWRFGARHRAEEVLWRARTAACHLRLCISVEAYCKLGGLRFERLQHVERRAVHGLGCRDQEDQAQRRRCSAVQKHVPPRAFALLQRQWHSWHVARGKDRVVVKQDASPHLELRRGLGCARRGRRRWRRGLDLSLPCVDQVPWDRRLNKGSLHHLLLWRAGGAGLCVDSVGSWCYIGGRNLRHAAAPPPQLAPRLLDAQAPAWRGSLLPTEASSRPPLALPNAHGSPSLRCRSPRGTLRTRCRAVCGVLRQLAHCGPPAYRGREESALRPRISEATAVLMESYPLKLGEAVPGRERPRDLVGEAGRLPFEGDRAAAERPSASIAVLTACRLGALIVPPRCGDGERLATVRSAPLAAGSNGSWSRSLGASGCGPSRGSTVGRACGVGGRAGSHVPALTMSAVGSANRATRVARFSCSAAPSGTTISAVGDRSRPEGEGERDLERALLPTAPGGRAASDGSACARA
eukprot:scaffold18385_cov42-Phaeocystis_antarctica.AAC.3